MAAVALPHFPRTTLAEARLPRHGQTMMRMTIPADLWDALVKKQEEMEDGEEPIRLEWTPDHKGVIRIDDETSLNLVVPRGAPQGVTSSPQELLNLVKAPEGVRVTPLAALPSGTPVYEAQGRKEEKEARVLEAGERARARAEEEKEKRNERKIVVMDQSPAVSAKARGKPKGSSNTVRVATGSAPGAAAATTLAASRPASKLLAPTLPKPPRHAPAAANSHAAGSAPPAPGVPLCRSQASSSSGSSSASSSSSSSSSGMPLAATAPSLTASAPAPAPTGAAAGARHPDGPARVARKPGQGLPPGPATRLSPPTAAAGGPASPGGGIVKSAATLKAEEKRRAKEAKQREAEAKRQGKEKAKEKGKEKAEKELGDANGKKGKKGAPKVFKSAAEVVEDDDNDDDLGKENGRLREENEKVKAKAKAKARERERERERGEVRDVDSGKKRGPAKKGSQREAGEVDDTVAQVQPRKRKPDDADGAPAAAQEDQPREPKRVKRFKEARRGRDLEEEEEGEVSESGLSSSGSDRDAEGSPDEEAKPRHHLSPPKKSKAARGDRPKTSSGPTVPSRASKSPAFAVGPAPAPAPAPTPSGRPARSVGAPGMAQSSSSRSSGLVAPSASAKVAAKAPAIHVQSPPSASTAGSSTAAAAATAEPQRPQDLALSRKKPPAAPVKSSKPSIKPPSSSTSKTVKAQAVAAAGKPAKKEKDKPLAEGVRRLQEQKELERAIKERERRRRKGGKARDANGELYFSSSDGEEAGEIPTKPPSAQSRLPAARAAAVGKKDSSGSGVSPAESAASGEASAAPSSVLASSLEPALKLPKFRKKGGSAGAQNGVAPSSYAAAAVVPYRAVAPTAAAVVPVVVPPNDVRSPPRAREEWPGGRRDPRDSWHDPRDQEPRAYADRYRPRGEYDRRDDRERRDWSERERERGRERERPAYERRWSRSPPPRRSRSPPRHGIDHCEPGRVDESRSGERERDNWKRDGSRDARRSAAPGALPAGVPPVRMVHPLPPKPSEAVTLRALAAGRALKAKQDFVEPALPASKMAAKPSSPPKKTAAAPAEPRPHAAPAAPPPARAPTAAEAQLQAYQRLHEEYRAVYGAYRSARDRAAELKAAVDARQSQREAGEVIEDEYVILQSRRLAEWVHRVASARSALVVKKGQLEAAAAACKALVAVPAAASG